MNYQKILVLSLLLGLSGCRRGAGKADPNYDQARVQYQKLYATELDDAYGDPKMEAVVQLLQKVDADSSDASAAQSMLGAIERGREAYAKGKPARDKIDAAAAAPVVMPNIDPGKVLAASAPPDAGPPHDEYGPGAAIADINRTSGGCLVAGEPFTERGSNRTGVIYRLSSAPACPQSLPGFVGQAVLVVDGAIYRRVDSAQVESAPAPPSEQQRPRAPAPRLPPAVSAQPPDAGP